MMPSTITDNNKLSITSFERAGCKEHVITFQSEVQSEFAQACTHVADAVGQRNASLIAFDIFGVPGSMESQLKEAFSTLPYPSITWLEGRYTQDAPFYSIVATALEGPEVTPLVAGERAVGVTYDIDGLRYCRLGGNTAVNLGASPKEQTEELFHNLEEALALANMDFTHVVRTWFYNKDMLQWYDSFNEVRTAFFQERGLFDRFVPASTGIGCRNGKDAALIAGVLAVAAHSQSLTPTEVLSPLQCPSFEYGSAFSRAMEFTAGGLRRLYISGTASIEPGGLSVHLGDVRAQIELTLDVVEAILVSRGMTWDCTTRSIAYFKHAEDAPNFATALKERGMPSLPGVIAHTDICRDDLLFELELDAIHPAG
ncbi:MAG: Rid family hydrolase [Candidatus Hydrogenedentales bacterium]|jgi:enamine deaminase RidA (YjgF/YER057c/UK114 family)